MTQSNQEDIPLQGDAPIIGFLLRVWEGSEIEKEREISVDDYGGSIKKARRKAENLKTAWKKKYKQNRHNVSVTLTPLQAYIPGDDE